MNYLLAGYLLVVLNIGASESKPVSLEECFQAALKKSETVGNQIQLVQQAEENYSQAVGSFLPTISGSVTYLMQPKDNSNPLANQFSPSEQTTVKLTADQPIFRGLREYAGLRQRRNVLESQQESKNRSVVQLFNDVVQSFYNVLLFRSDLRNYRTEIQVNQKRFQDLKSFTRSGRNRESDAISVQSNIATLEAQVYLTEGQLKAAQESLAFLTAFEPETDLSDLEDLPKDIGPLETYLNQVELRPEVKAAKKDLDASDDAVGIAWGAHLPSIDVIADYYPVRPGLLANYNWDVQFTASIPLFSGGVTQSQVRVAAADRKAKELALSKARRFAEQEIRSLYYTYVADLGQFEKLKEASELTHETFLLEEKDYRLGLSTNLEVLQAMDQAQQTRRAFDRATLTAKADFAKLEAAAQKRRNLLSN